MKKSSKIILGITVFMVLILGILIIIPFVIDVEKFLPQIESLAKKTLGREVKIEGIKLSVLKGLEIKLNGIEIANQEGFAQEPFVEVSEVSARIGITALAQNQIDIKRISLIKPIIRMERNQAGELSISDLKKKEPEPAPAPSPEKKPAGLEIAGRKVEIGALEIKQARLIFTDYKDQPQKPSTLELNNFNLLLENISQDKPISIESSFCLGEDGDKKNFSIQGKLGPLGEKIEPKNIPVDLALELSQLDFGLLAGYLSDALPLKILTGIASGEIIAKGGYDNLALSTNLNITDLSFQDKGETWEQSPKTQLSLISQISLTLADKLYQIKKADLTLGKSQLGLIGEMKGDKYRFEINQAKLEMGDLSQLVYPLKKLLSEKKASISGYSLLSLKIEKASPLSFQTSLDLKDTNLAWPGLLKKAGGEKLLMSLKGKGDEKGYLFENIALGLAGAEIDGAGSISQDKNINLSVVGNEVAISELKKIVEPIAKYGLDGKMNLKARLYGPLSQTENLGLKIDNLAVKGTEMDFALQGSVENFSAPRVRFNLEGNELNLDRLMPAEQKPQPTTPPQAKEGSSSLNALDVEGKLNLKKLLVKGYNAENVRANLTMKKGVLMLDDTNVNMFKGKISGPVKVDLGSKKTSFQTNINVSSIELPEPFKTMTALANAIFGKVDGNINLSGTGAGWEELKNTLNGKGKIMVNNGSLKTVDMTGSLVNGWTKTEQFRNFMKTGLGEKDYQILDETPFTKAQLEFAINQGEVEITNLEMGTKQGELSAKGKFDFNYQVKFKGVLTLSESDSNELAKKLGIGPDGKRYFFKNGKYLYLPFELKGKFPKPQVNLDTEEYGKIVAENLKAMAQQEIEKQTDQLKKEVEKKVDDWLKQFKP